MSISLNPTALRRLKELLAAPRGKRVGVLGLGVSGRAMAQHLARRHFQVLAVDSRNDDAMASTVGLLQAAGVQTALGDCDATTFAHVDGLCISPGVDPRQPAVQAVLRADKPVFGELELAGPLPAPCIAITGTNGKSTTTALVGALALGRGQEVFVGGNFGPSIVAWLDSGTPADVAVLELSSYQLETAYTFAPEVGVVLNVTPDHLERYPTLEAYAAAKARLVAGVAPHGTVVLSADDPVVASMAPLARARVLWFSTRDKPLPGDGVNLVGTTLTGQGGLRGFGPCNLQHPRLLGVHNRENALAAFLALHALGLAPHAEDLAHAYLDFHGLEHRLEWAGEVAGVQYINDSKATNDASAAIGLQAMERPVVLLAGGKDKGGGYSQLMRAARQKSVRGVVAFGAAAEKIAEAASAYGVRTQRCGGLLDACAIAATLAQPGDVVLLSPACSSFDEFSDYTHRGRVFKQWVKTRPASVGAL